MTGKRFVSWSAVSTLPQAKKISLEDQKIENRRHIERHGGTLVAELVVPGESRSIVLFEDACRRIDAYARLRQLIDSKAFDILIYLDRSRLGRKASLSMAVVELCHEAGILTYEVESPPTSLDELRISHDDALIGAIKSVGAQQEIEKFRERHRKGMIGRTLAGKQPNRPMYGYRTRTILDPETNTYVLAINAATGEPEIVVNESEAVAIRRTFDLYLQGHGIRTIAEQLNSDGLAPAEAERWSQDLVRQILDRVWSYAGYAEVNRYTTVGKVKRAELQRTRPYTRARATWQPIIDEAIVPRILEERDIRANNRRVSDTPYLLSRLVFCDDCQRHMKVNRLTLYREKDGAVRGHTIRLRCQDTGNCPTIGQNKLVSLLRYAIEQLREHGIESALEMDVPIQDEQLQEKIAACDVAIGRIKANRRRASDAYADGIMPLEDYDRQLQRLAAQIAAQEAEIARLHARMIDVTQHVQRRNRLQELIDNGLQMLDLLDVTHANAWLRQRVRIHTQQGQVILFEWL